MAILALKTARGWNLSQTARTFLIEPDTLSEWLQRLDQGGEHALIQIHEPVNRFPSFVRHVVGRLKTLCPAMGKQRIAEMLARAGLQLSATSVARFLGNLPPKSHPPQPVDIIHHPSGRIVTANHPNHVWNIDLTVVPTSGFWVPWFPFSLLQVWPFAYWVAVVIDHFSRKVMGFAVFKKQPTSLDIRSFLGRVIRAVKTSPKHLISDRGKQFDCDAFRKWAKRRKIKLRYGAIGKYGSIAVIERFILSLKTEFTNHLLIPFNMNEFRHELGFYTTWYNEDRPHQSRNGRTPQEIYSEVRPQAPPHEPGPNSKLPVMKLRVSHLHGNKLLPLVELSKAA
jgi:putative transposase